MKEVAGQASSLAWGHTVARTPSLIKAMMMIIRRRRMMRVIMIIRRTLGGCQAKLMIKHLELIISFISDNDQM